MNRRSATIGISLRRWWPAVIFCLGIGFPWGSRPATLEVREVLAARLDSLSGDLALLDTALRSAAGGDSLAGVAEALVGARIAFKRVEGLLEYFDPVTAAILNGREPYDGDDDDGPSPVVDTTTGFLALEPLVVEDATSAEMTAAARHARLMRLTVLHARDAVRTLRAEEAHLLAAARAEVARVATLGLGGRDAPALDRVVPEASAALAGIGQALRQCLSPREGEVATSRRATADTLERAVDRLDRQPPAEAFDHFGFIADYLYPAARAIHREIAARRLTIPGAPIAWKNSAPFIFDRDAWDPMAYAPSSARPADSLLIALGRRLFADSALSGNRNRACISCHLPDRAFTEERARTGLFERSANRGRAYGGANRASGGSSGVVIARNTPTLINAALQPNYFADERAISLEDQIAEVVANPLEMRGNLDTAAARLRASPSYRKQFEEAFRATGDSSVTGRRIREAIAGYIRSLVALESRFDLAIRGRPELLTASERRGFNLFMGKAKCGTCHYAPLFGGTVPPDYQASPVEVVGTPVLPDTVRGLVDPDEGRFAIDTLAPHKFAFRTPTLRNVALTAPYMHNGVYRTLEAVVDFYNRGGGVGIGIALSNQTLPAEPLGLTTDERADLVSFLKSLTDTTGVR